MTRTIPGQPGTHALAQLAGEHDGERMRHFATLSRDEQAAVIRGMAREGWSDYGIAGATGLSVEAVRRILSQQHRHETTTTDRRMRP